MASTAEIVNCLEKLASVYPGVERTRETMDLYVEMLATGATMVVRQADRDAVALKTGIKILAP